MSLSSLEFGRHFLAQTFRFHALLYNMIDMNHTCFHSICSSFKTREFVFIHAFDRLLVVVTWAASRITHPGGFAQLANIWSSDPYLERRFVIPSVHVLLIWSAWLSGKKEQQQRKLCPKPDNVVGWHKTDVNVSRLSVRLLLWRWLGLFRSQGVALL